MKVSNLKYAFLLLGGLLLVFALCGCTINQDFVTSCDKSWQTIGPEYIQYVSNDDTIDSRTKDIRLRTAELFTRMIEEAKDE